MADMALDQRVKKLLFGVKLISVLFLLLLALQIGSTFMGAMYCGIT